MIFESENDWLQFLEGFILSIVLLFAGGNIIATFLAVFVFLLGCYYAFGKKIIIYESHFTYRNVLARSQFELEEVNYVEFNLGFLGKSFIAIVLKNGKKRKGFCSGANWVVLRKILMSKNIKFTSR